MAQIHQPQFQRPDTANRLEALFQTLDDLHTAASDNQLVSMTSLSETEVVNWLKDFVYTAQETIAEIEKARPPVDHNPSASYLRLVK